jgi:hypothetical protein
MGETFMHKYVCVRVCVCKVGETFMHKCVCVCV